jgi:hypothetical protein
MILTTGATYTNDISALAITVKNIIDETSDYYIIFGMLFNKVNHKMYELKYFKVEKTTLSTWRKV